MISYTTRGTAVSALAPAAAVTATATGPSVDLLNFMTALLVINVGAITDGTHTPKLQESDDNATWNDVFTNTTGVAPRVTSDLFPYDLTTSLGAAGAVASQYNYALNALVANTVQWASYVGAKRYIRLVVTVTGAPATGGFYSAVVFKTNGQHQQQGSQVPRP